MEERTLSMIISDMENHPGLPRLLQSVAGQAGLPETAAIQVEIIVAGNGTHAPSAPSLWQSITGLDRIRLLNIDPKSTPAGIFNNAVREAEGDGFIFLRPDHRLDSKYLTTILSVFEDHPGADVVYPDYIRLASRQDHSSRPEMLQLPRFRDSLLQTRGFLGPGVWMSRKAWEGTLGFRDNTLYMHWDLWIQAALAGMNFYHVSYPLASCEHVKISFRERAEDGRSKAMIVINNQGYFHDHTVRWALSYLRGEAWAEAHGFMNIPGPMEVTRMLHDHAMRIMGADALTENAIRQFDQVVLESGASL